MNRPIVRAANAYEAVRRRVGNHALNSWSDYLNILLQSPGVVMINSDNFFIIYLDDEENDRIFVASFAGSMHHAANALWHMIPARTWLYFQRYRDFPGSEGHRVRRFLLSSLLYRLGVDMEPQLTQL